MQARHSEPAPSPPLPRKRGREQVVPVAWSCKSTDRAHPAATLIFKIMLVR